MIHPGISRPSYIIGGRRSPGLGCVLDDIAVRKAQRQDVCAPGPRRARFASSAGVLGGQQKLAVLPDDQELTIAYAPYRRSRISLVHCMRMPLTGAACRSCETVAAHTHVLLPLMC